MREDNAPYRDAQAKRRLPVDCRLFEAARHGDDLAREALAAIDHLQTALRDNDARDHEIHFALSWFARSKVGGNQTVMRIAELMKFPLDGAAS